MAQHIFNVHFNKVVWSLCTLVKSWLQSTNWHIHYCSNFSCALFQSLLFVYPTLCSQSTTDLLFYKDLFALSRTLQNGIKYYVLLLRVKVWLLPLSKIILRFTHVFAWINISIFFIAKWYLIRLQYHNLCIHWCVKGNLGYLGYNFKI